ncbi:hypothetical protein [Enterobacter cloacae]|uniref:hypothetical protein n=1 Tax=Enterobacter cloacae TaxID=550 RepID=UPI0005890881|nr:hypothetical protein [Enterobacter cloacae]KIF96450.1 hypothetical protein SD66_08620 [Enterobacter cloacae]
MSLSPLQRLDLQDRLVDLLIQRPTAKGLDLLELLEQINEVLILLGYSADEETKPEPEAPGKPPAGEEPQIVTDFKAGVFSSVPASDFIKTLRQIDAYEPEYISLDEVKKGAVAWVSNNPDKFARAA